MSRQGILESQEIQESGINLDLLAQQVVEGFIVGLHKSPFHGFSVEFAEHRLYNSGESIKNIDWKVLARTDKMFVKKFEEETNLRCQIVLDGSSTMYFPYDEKQPDKFKYTNKLCFAAQCAAVLMKVMRGQRDAYGLTIFDEDLRIATDCKSSASHYQLLLSYLYQLIENPKLGKSTNLPQTLHLVADKTHRRSLVVIFTDVIETMQDADRLFAALQHLKHNKHEVILFHVADAKHELQFDYENRPYVFIDMETNKEVRLQPNQVKEGYIAQVKDFMDALRMKCLQYRIDFVEADIQQGFYQVLQTWMIKRSKMLR